MLEKVDQERGGGSWLKYKIRGGGSLSISEPLRDPADISRCIVNVNWAPDLSIAKFLGPGSQIRQDPAYFNHWVTVEGGCGGGIEKIWVR